MRLRPVRPDEDQAAIIDLVGGVYQEYGDRVWLEGADADLGRIQAEYLDAGGAFVVLEDEEPIGTILGTHAVLPRGPRRCVFRRLYLHPSLRGQGWGDRLMDWAVNWALEHDLFHVDFWSDTRFQRAHRFFERHGFRRDGRVRQMDDGAMPYQEYHFVQDLGEQ